MLGARDTSEWGACQLVAFFLFLLALVFVFFLAAFFCVTRFDPHSDKWLRITLFQGGPYPHELHDGDWDGWIWGVADAQP